MNASLQEAAKPNRGALPGLGAAARAGQAKDAGSARSKPLADHFLECCKLNRYLTVADGHRFIITDDLGRDALVPSDAAAMAAIYSRDKLVAQAAVVPLGQMARKLRKKKDRAAYERLFTLIEEQALDDRVRDSAKALIEHGFRDAEIKAIEASLNDQLNPARVRYRQFLDVVKRLMDGQVAAKTFVDEFKSFTADVAGRLDFGIYSFCLDRLFGSLRIPLGVKQLLVGELLNLPPLIRRELVTNVLTYPGQSDKLKTFVRHTVLAELGRSVAIEIELLEAYKLKRLTMADLAGGL